MHKCNTCGSIFVIKWNLVELRRFKQDRVCIKLLHINLEDYLRIYKNNQLKKEINVVAVRIICPKGTYMKPFTKLFKSTTNAPLQIYAGESLGWAQKFPLTLPPCKHHSWVTEQSTGVSRQVSRITVSQGCLESHSKKPLTSFKALLQPVPSSAHGPNGPTHTLTAFPGERRTCLHHLEPSIHAKQAWCFQTSLKPSRGGAVMKL